MDPNKTDRTREEVLNKTQPAGQPSVQGHPTTSPASPASPASPMSTPPVQPAPGPNHPVPSTETFSGAPVALNETQSQVLYRSEVVVLDDTTNKIGGRLLLLQKRLRKAAADGVLASSDAIDMANALDSEILLLNRIGKDMLHLVPDPR